MSCAALRVLLVGALFALVGIVLAENTPPRVSLRLETREARVRAQVAGRVVVEFAPGLHAYQNPPTEDYLIPIEVKSGSSSTILVGRPRYPRGTLKKVGGPITPSPSTAGASRFPLSSECRVAREKSS